MRLASERFLVTGALGCIGAWTVRELIRNGVPVVGYDLGANARRLAQIMTPEELARVTLVGGDITDLDGLDRTLAEHDITNVIHLAALQVPFCRADPPLGARVNVVGTVNVFESVRRRGAGMAPVVYMGSIGMFSASDVDPVTNQLREDAEPHPGNHYGVYKLANEGTARLYLADAGVPSVGLRPMTVFGAGRDQGMTSGARRRAGVQSRREPGRDRRLDRCDRGGGAGGARLDHRRAGAAAVPVGHRAHVTRGPGFRARDSVPRRDPRDR